MRNAWNVAVIAVVAVVALVTGCTSSGSPEPEATCPIDSTEPPPPADCPANVEFCGIGDLDIMAWCRDGQVFAEAPVVYDYCTCGTNQSACRLVKGQGLPPRLTCPGACLDEDLHYLESIEEWNNFEPESLCAPPDAGPPDAGPPDAGAPDGGTP